MKTIDVLIIVDALGAVASGDLSGNVYLVDTNKYLGSWNEGQCELHTKCYDGQIIKWRVESISPDEDVNIVKFVGVMIDQKVCIPSQQGIQGDIYWEGRVQARGVTGPYQYACVLSIDGKQMTFDPFLEVINPA
ncbi:hypothetical protein DBR32_02915 [Taibaiella sp. KBW10]|uniref:alpha-pore-forming tripartite toxin MakABE regulator n=1 Tax=Taibaiella sp. KBW10 TaxID=2153357 RepID=UPI000F5AA54F|nr:hypothetical protein [Taibaiella sp. KBW10]RQO32563.1 hypothetical protein DBR32_02915 [Taibaiella sp. KBW10]